MHFTALLLLPLPLLVFTHPVIVVEHETVAHPIQNHVDPLHPIPPRCVTIKTRRSLTVPEETMKFVHHTTSPHRPSDVQSKPKPRSLLSRALTFLHLVTPHTTSPHSPNQPQPEPHPTLLTRTLSRRDSITISISSTMNSTQICNSQNDISAKFEVVNNAKNADISVGDDVHNNTSNFSTFGNKNMFNSTGSNTGGWNTKNKGSDLDTGRGGRVMKRGIGAWFRDIFKKVGENLKGYIQGTVIEFAERVGLEFVKGKLGRRGEGLEELEKRSWREWFDDLLVGGDYGRWEMPWRAPGPGSSKGEKDKWESGGNIAVHPSKTAATTKTTAMTMSAEPTYTQNPGPTPIITIPRPGGNKTEPYRPAYSEHGPPRPTIPRPKFGNHTWHGNKAEHRIRDIVNPNIVGGISKSNMTSSGNNNTVEVYVLGNGDSVVNITVVWEGARNDMKNSGNGNTVRVYIGDSHGVDMGDSTLKVIGGE